MTDLPPAWRESTEERMGRVGELIRMVLVIYFVAHDFVIWLLACLRPRRNLIKEDSRGNIPRPGSRNVAVYVHFDRSGVVHDYVLHQLEDLVDANFRIVLVSNSPTFPDESRARVMPLCERLILRQNAGYDFGAYKDGIAALGDLDDLDSLLLMNDSIYGPFWKISETLSAIDRSSMDFWGIADSWEHQYHLQTFFLVFFPAALRSRAFKEFWKNHPYIDNKGWVIRNGEVKLTQELARQQFRAGSLALYWELAEKMKDRLAAIDTSSFSAQDKRVFNRVRTAVLRGRGINSMHYFWDLLIEDYKCPFIKRELLRSNPAGVYNVSQWPDVISSRSGYDVSVIKKHLAS